MSQSLPVRHEPRPLVGSPSFSIGWLFTGWIVACLLVTAGLVTMAATAEQLPPDAARLTDGVWVGRTLAGETVLQLVAAGDHLAGHSYLVRDGKAVSEVPVVAVTVAAIEPDGERPGGPAGEATQPGLDEPNEPDAPRELAVEIRLRTGWTVRGRLSADRTVLDGVLDLGRGRSQDLALHRTPLSAVPAVLPRPPAPPGEPAFSGRRPDDTGDGWQTARAADSGLDPARIEALVNDVLSGEAGLIHSLLMVKGDRLVVEEYFHGFDREDLHAINSCTKSVASLLVGLAIERGELAGVDTRVLELFPELREGAAPGWDDLRVEHLLTMTSGTAWRGGQPPAGPALVRAALARPPVSPPGARWSYSDLSADLLAAVLHRATGLHADAYAANHLFGPLGITRWNWESGRTDGFPRLHGTLEMRPRDLAKLGVLVLGGGRWQGRQVISEEWIREATRAHITAPDAGGAGYGYLWWREPVPPSSSGPVFAARGVGSQLVYVAPALDLVVVVTGGNALNGLDFRIGELLLRHLGPAASGATPSTGGGGFPGRRRAGGAPGPRRPG